MDEAYLMDTIIADAYLKGATGVLVDSSADPGESNVLFLLNGMMKEYMTIRGDTANDIIKRLKRMANLDHEGINLPKIGRIIFKHKGLPEFPIIIILRLNDDMREKVTLRIQTA